MNRGLLLSLLLVSISALVWSSAASAGPRRDMAKARAYHKAGKKAYAAGEFDEAARNFSAGYTLDPKPGFLLNIAQSYRKADKPKKAIHYYEEFLRLEPKSKLRPQVEELIKEIEQEVKDTAAAPAPDPLPAMDLTEEPPPPPKSEPIYKKWWFWTGVATVVVAASVGIGVYAGTREPDYVKEGGLGSVRW